MTGFVAAVDRISLALAAIAAVMTALAVTIVTWMILWRALGNSTFWEIEASVFLMVAAIFLASPYALRTKGHVSVDALEMILPEGARRGLAVFVQLFVMVVAAYLAWEGLKMTLEAIHTGERTNSLWAPPKWPLYAAMPVGLALTILQGSAEIMRLVRGDQPQRGTP